MDLAIGQVYGEKYRIVRLLGQGSMGAVYEGENIRIRRKVAIKTLHHGMAEKGDTLQRFEREAQAAGRIGSKHIVEVLDMGDLPDGSRYMVMEHLEGTTLQQHIRSMGRVKPEEASPIVQQLLEGLGAAHAAGIIHRDLKPANAFLVRQPGRADFVKILDFGVSKFSVFSEEMSMTRTGTVLGTPYYMSPEQAKGARGTDGRSDLYAVGVILYECITGQVPFSAETFNELLFRIVLESPPPPESFVPDLSPALAAIIRKAMAREPNERFQTADELKKALAEWSAKAEEEAGPNFDGLATLDHQTVMRNVGATPPSAAPRNTPFPMQPTAPAPKPGLRPAQPSITASGTLMVEPKEPPKTGLSALGTVIIDAAVAEPTGGSTGGTSRDRNGHGSAATAPRQSPATQPLPQWPGPAAPGAQQQLGPNGSGSEPIAHNASPPNAMPFADPTHRASYPLISANGSAEPIPFDTTPRQAVLSTSLPRGRPRNAMQAVAALGIATGLLAGVAAWAILWRTPEEPQSQSSSTSAETSTASPAVNSQPTGGPSAAEAAPTPSTETSSSAGTPTPPPAEPSSGANSEPAAPRDKPPEPVASTSTSPKTALPKTATTTSAKATAGPSEKPGKTNPSGGRTVSSDL